jgi:hypothetical protein
VVSKIRVPFKVDKRPVPIDGYWVGGQNFGLPQGYYAQGLVTDVPEDVTFFGWNSDLTPAKLETFLDNLTWDTLTGCTANQARAAFYVEGGQLCYDTDLAIAAGAATNFEAVATFLITGMHASASVRFNRDITVGSATGKFLIEAMTSVGGTNTPPLGASSPRIGITVRHGDPSTIGAQAFGELSTSGSTSASHFQAQLNVVPHGSKNPVVVETSNGTYTSLSHLISAVEDRDLLDNTYATMQARWRLGLTRASTGDTSRIKGCVSALNVRFIPVDLVDTSFPLVPSDYLAFYSAIDTGYLQTQGNIAFTQGADVASLYEYQTTSGKMLPARLESAQTRKTSATVAQAPVYFTHRYGKPGIYANALLNRRLISVNGLVGNKTYFTLCAVFTPVRSSGSPGAVWCSATSNNAWVYLAALENNQFQVGGRRISSNTFASVSGGSFAWGEVCAVIAVYDYINGRLELYKTDMETPDAVSTTYYTGVTENVVGTLGILNHVTAANHFFGIFHEAALYDRPLSLAEKEAWLQRVTKTWGVGDNIRYPLQGAQAPGDISGLQIWMDASDQTTFNPNPDLVWPPTASGDPVATVLDPRGETQGIIGTGGAGTNAPIYNMSAGLAFAGNQWVNYTTTNVFAQTGMTIFVVGNFNVLNTNTMLCAKHATAGPFYLGRTSTNSLRAMFQTTGSGRIDVAFDGFTSTSTHIFRQHYDGTSGILAVDGDVKSSLSLTGTLTSNTAPVYLGRYNTTNWNLDGNIREVLMFNRSLTPTEIETVESYLATKWGVSL